MHTEHARRTILARPGRAHRTGERGAILVVVLLIVVALTSVGLVAVRKAATEVSYAGSAVKRERALMVAQAALDLAAAQYKEITNDPLLPPNAMNNHLQGVPQQFGDCTSACSNCIPNRPPNNFTITGQRNELLSSQPIDCGGRPCMRQGAVAFLADSGGQQVNWCDMPFRNLVMNGDPEANVSVWVRNNASEVLGADGTQNWTMDADNRIVITAQATIRNTSVAIEQEVMLNVGGQADAWNRPLAPEGYGGGHNNDNATVSSCAEDAVLKNN